MEMKMMLIAFISVVFLSGCNEVPQYQNPETVEYTIQSENTINDDVKEAVQVIEENLKYAEEEDMEGYLSTIVSSAREETKKELAPFFESYDMDFTILSVEVLEQEENILLIQTEQQTIAVTSPDEDEPYRDHIAEANHTLVKENDEWKIQETIMTDTVFLEYD